MVLTEKLDGNGVEPEERDKVEYIMDYPIDNEMNKYDLD